MKILTPTSLIAVEVPKDAICWISQGHSGNYYLYYNLNDEEEEYSKKLEGNFQILGEVTDTGIQFDCDNVSVKFEEWQSYESKLIKVKLIILKQK